ncbi:hypothetical protein [Carboxylicivirga caseinilyticus]|uniref:hypothetical protein n=1 Tax=Carboxylicivirga caseinilyticus TaxID=3417572 RepID=UPI003D33094D|nr:hypothetical protein [Marinilabiliaceae bacterium A049]
MDLLFNNAWIFFIVVTILNGLIMKHRSKRYISENPGLQFGYDKYFKGLIFYGNIPWIIIAIGNLSGLTHSIFDYVNPKTMNPIVLVFHGAIAFLWILCVRWVYFKGGAEFFETHPGLFQKSSLSGKTNITAKQVKLYLPLIILSGIFAMIMMWTTDFTNP